MSDPKHTHLMDQLTAQHRDFGRNVGAIYAGLLESGVPDGVAILALCAYMNGLAIAGQQKPIEPST